MRILHIDKFLPRRGGVGSYIDALDRLLASAGCQLFHFGCDCDGNRPDLPEYIDLRRLHGRSAIRAAARMFHNRSAASSLDAFLDAYPVDVAHVHNIYHHLSPSVLAVLRRRRIPAVMTAHDYRLACPAKHFFCPRTAKTCTRCLTGGPIQALRNRCEGSFAASALIAAETMVHRRLRSYQRNLAAVICPTPFMHQTLLAIGWPDSKLAELPNPIRVPRLTRSTHGCLILAASRFSPEKAMHRLLSLAAALPNARIIAAGDGPELPAVRHAAQVKSLTNLELPGQLDQTQLDALYAAAALVVIPSDCYEVSPQTMLEAMHAGIPVVAPAHGPFSWWIDDRRTGRLFTHGNDAHLARVVAETLADPAQAHRLGSAAADLVRRRHNPQTILRRLLDIYERARSCA